MEIETKVVSAIKSIPTAYKQTFWIAFSLINLAFLFHTVNFMFGDHDWNYVRTANYWSEGAFEGRPLHFILQSLFFGGEVLPILNNLLSFGAMTISGILLAKYWQIPFSKTNYTLFTVFVAVLPYTMVWLFYAKDTLINLSLPLIAVSGLLAAEYATKHHKTLYHLLAIALFYFAFSSYVAIINLLGVCYIASLVLKYVDGKESIVVLIKQKLFPVGDMLVALILFQLTLSLLKVDTSYNTQTIDITYLPQKLIETLTVMLTQFTTMLPFMEYKYKLLLLLLSLQGFIFLMIKGGVGKIFPIVVLCLGVLFASKLAFFLAEERGQILAEMENFAFVPRLDFYGLVYIYAFGLACILKYAPQRVYKYSLAFAIVLTFMSMVRDMYAQKVWKLGFDAEMKAHERIISRLENRTDFMPNSRRYRIFQVGSLSLRNNFYIKNKNEETSLDLLATSFTPQFMSRIVYNFYYPKDIFYANAELRDLSPRGREFLYQAKPFPHPNSIFIDGDIIIIVLTEEGIKKALYQ